MIEPKQNILSCDTHKVPLYLENHSPILGPSVFTLACSQDPVMGLLISQWPEAPFQERQRKGSYLWTSFSIFPKGTVSPSPCDSDLVMWMSKRPCDLSSQYQRTKAFQGFIFIWIPWDPIKMQMLTQVWACTPGDAGAICPWTNTWSGKDLKIGGCKRGTEWWVLLPCPIPACYCASTGEVLAFNESQIRFWSGGV